MDDWQMDDEAELQEPPVDQEPTGEGKGIARRITIRGRPVRAVFLHQAAAAPTNPFQQKEAELGWDGTEILNKSAKSNRMKEEVANAKAKHNAIKERSLQEVQLCQERSAAVARPAYDAPPEDLHVATGYQWAKMHPPHTPLSCDATVFCSSCGKTSAS